MLLFGLIRTGPRPLSRSTTCQASITFEPLSGAGFEALLEGADANAVSVVRFRAPWDRSGGGDGGGGIDPVSTVVERLSEQWPGAAYYIVDLVRGTSVGERVFAAHSARHAQRRPGEAYCGSPHVEVYLSRERVDTLTMPRAPNGAVAPMVRAARPPVHGSNRRKATDQ